MSQPMPIVGGLADLSRWPRLASQMNIRSPLNGGAAG